MLKQEEEVHGKQRELDRLKDEEKELMTDIKKSEREIQRIEDDLKIVQELEEEVSFMENFITFALSQPQRRLDSYISPLFAQIYSSNPTSPPSDGREIGGVGGGRKAHEGGHAAVRERGGGLLQRRGNLPGATQASGNFQTSGRIVPLLLKSCSPNLNLVEIKFRFFLRMDMDHMPDYAKLDKPKRPPVPEVSSETLL